MSALRLEIVTPDRTVVSTDVDIAVCPGTLGEFGVLAHHVSLLSALKPGILRYTTEGTSKYVFISGGFADVNDNVLTVLAESAELAEDIDSARAEAAKQRAENRLASKEENVDRTRAELALKRALFRLQACKLH